MVNTADGGADYPPEVPLEDEPERFIKGSAVSDKLENKPLEPSSDTDNDDEPTDDDFARVNDG